MDKLMEVLHKGLRTFFDWWGNLTGIENKSYFDGKLNVNWVTITPMLILIVLGVLFLPSGIVDSFIYSYD